MRLYYIGPRLMMRLSPETEALVLSAVRVTVSSMPVLSSPCLMAVALVKDGSTWLITTPAGATDISRLICLSVQSCHDEGLHEYVGSPMETRSYPCT